MLCHISFCFVFLFPPKGAVCLALLLRVDDFELSLWVCVCVYVFSVVPSRFFAKRKRKIKPMRKKKDANHPTNWTRWRFADYLEKKDNEVSIVV